MEVKIVTKLIEQVKFIVFSLFLFGNVIYSQNSNSQEVFVLIENTQDFDLFKFEKLNEKCANIKILKFEFRNEGFNGNKKQNDDEIITVKTQPSISNYYEFNSIAPPKKVNSIDEYKVYNIVDVSKNISEVWKKYPYTITFIEKLDNENYCLWKMNPIIYE